MGWPQAQSLIKPLAAGISQQPDEIFDVEMLGHKGNLQWKQDANGLRVDMPNDKPCDHAIALKIATA
jgi:alpha-L-fucosidase